MALNDAFRDYQTAQQAQRVARQGARRAWSHLVNAVEAADTSEVARLAGLLDTMSAGVDEWGNQLGATVGADTVDFIVTNALLNLLERSPASTLWQTLEHQVAERRSALGLQVLAAFGLECVVVRPELGVDALEAPAEAVVNVGMDWTEEYRKAAATEEIQPVVDMVANMVGVSRLRVFVATAEVFLLALEVLIEGVSFDLGG